jgi:alpha-tubulin suppressor-like RCC1 family protein
VAQVASGFVFDAALKRDGSVWVWGMSGKDLLDSSGVVGTGQTNTVSVTRPTRVRFPPSIFIARIAASPDGMFALDSTGSVWSWGGGPSSSINRGSGNPDFATPQRVQGLPPVAQMAIGGDGFAYALDCTGHLWGWGIRGTYLGLGPANGGWVPTPAPMKLSFPEFGGQNVSAAAASAHSTHVILADGSLWGWGDAALGEVGDGTVLDLSKSGYSWDWGTFERLVFRPVRIAPGAGRFKALYSNGQAFYTYAVTDDDRIFSWGRNKTGILGNGILPTGDAAKHPDSWDVPTATQVSPLTRQPPTPVPAKSS